MSHASCSMNLVLHTDLYTDRSLHFLPIMAGRVAGRVAGSIWTGLLATPPCWIGEKYSQTMPLILLVTTFNRSVLFLLTKCSTPILSLSLSSFLHGSQSRSFHAESIMLAFSVSFRSAKWHVLKWNS
jgi:hypothetical protein